jgi:uncharacterized protein (DUF433 family)
MESGSEHAVVSAFTLEQAARLSGINEDRLRKWDSSKFFRPSFAAENRRVPFSRIYSFTDLLALRIIRTLSEEHGVSTRHLKQVGKALCQLGNRPWTEERLYVLAGKIYFEDPETGGKRQVVSGQYAFPVALRKVVGELRRDIDMMSLRDDKKRGQIERHKFVAKNVPTIAGTRIPVDAIIRFDRAGYTISQILEEYPGLSEQDVRAALTYRAKIA